jgi:hypothetical protein
MPSVILPSSERLRLMLRAALLEDERADRAWEAWRAAPGELTPEERQLAPTLYRALARRGVQDAALDTLVASSRRAWLVYQSNRAVARAVLTRLRERRIETLVLKGTALIPTYYRDPAARRSGDVDLLVSEERLSDAWDLLAADGWRPVANDRRYFNARFSHAVQLVDGRGRSLDLHCHVLATNCERGADAPFWSAAVPFMVDGAETRTLCATDHLLHVCVHGQLRSYVPAVRWYADAMVILRTAVREIDWTRVVELARARRVTLQAAAAFDDLVRLLDAPVPAAARRELRVTPVGVLDRMVFDTGTADLRGRPLLTLQAHCGRFLRGTVALTVRDRLRQIPSYLRWWLQVPSGSRMVGRLLFRAGRSLAIRAHLLPPEAASHPLQTALRARDDGSVPGGETDGSGPPAVPLVGGRSIQHDVAMAHPGGEAHQPPREEAGAVRENLAGPE